MAATSFSHRPSPLPSLVIPAPIASVAIDPQEAGAGADLINPHSPVQIIRGRENQVPFVLIEGGVAGTRREATRCGVSEIVRESGAAAGLNGTFFADASLRGEDNLLIGPSLCGNEPHAVLSPFDQRMALTGRPLVLLSTERTRILPYNPETMDTEAALRTRLPDLADAFLGGVWLVHNGICADKDQIAAYQVRDADDFRRRAFFALMPDGRPCIGATTYVASSTELARALQSAGVQEAVLLDSGFSTSLVYRNKILVTGHTSPGIPSRPVPHAIVLFDKKLPTTTRNVAAMAGKLRLPLT